MRISRRDRMVGDRVRRLAVGAAIIVSACGGPPETPAHVVDSWKTYFQHVRLHEAGHRAIAEQNARDLLAALSSMRAATCQAVMDAASRTGERIVAEGRAKNRAYDVQTKHGQTQGVVLPP